MKALIAVGAMLLIGSTLLGDARAELLQADVLLAAAAGEAGVQGEVRRIDKEARKITLRHGPMPKLDMPPMTMVFQVKDSAMLERIKVGEKVVFDATYENGAYTVIRIEAAK